MSFFKKLSETVLDTASTIGSKSADLVETGKLKLQRNQLENSIKDKKTAIGDLVYEAQKKGSDLSIEDLAPLFAEIKDLESQIEAVDEKLRKENPQDQRPVTPPLSSSVPQENNPGATVFVLNVGRNYQLQQNFAISAGNLKYIVSQAGRLFIISLLFWLYFP